MTRRLFSTFAGGASLMLGLALLSSPSQSLAQPSSNEFLRSNPQMFAAMTEVVAKPSAFTVRVRCLDKDAALGTIVGPNGWIVTKASELKGPATVLLKDGRSFAAKLVGVDNANDLAMLKVETTGLPIAEWRDSKEAAVGSWVATPGVGKEPVAVGVISVSTRRLPTERVAPSNKSGYLGVQMLPNAMGVRIDQVMKDTPAEKAGIKAGDIVVGLDSASIKTVDQMMEMLAGRKPGDKIALKVLRDGAEIELKATLARRPRDQFNRGEMQNNMGSTLSARRINFPMVLQHDTVLKPTDCGGPLVDLDGKVVGINIARAGRTESYALPSENVQMVLFDLMSGKLTPVASTQSPTASGQLAESEARRAQALAAKAAAEKELKDADAAVQKAKQQLEAERKKSEEEKKTSEPTKSKAESKDKP